MSFSPSAPVEYPQAWYPLLCSGELARGRALAVRAFSDDLVAWRGRDGQAAVMARHCAHMGADLARGRVRGNDLVCPLHGLHVDLSGRGRFAVESNPEPGPCQFTLPVVERHGVVFVYLGAQAAGDAPVPAGEPPRYWSRPYARYFETSFDAVCLNNFDRQHFATVHGRELIAYTIERPAEAGLRACFRSRIAGDTFADRLMRAAGVSEVGIEVDIHGGNVAMMRNPRTSAAALVATLPVEEQVSRLFVVTFGAHQSRVRFAIQSRIVMHFLRQDMRALDGMRIRLDAALLAGDPVLRQWDEYLCALPRTSIARLSGSERVAGPLTLVAAQASGRDAGRA